MTGGSPYLNLHDFAVSAEQPQPGLQAPEQPQLIEGVVRPINPDDTANTSPKIVLKPDPVPRNDPADDDDVRSMLE